MQPLVGIIMGSKSDWDTMSHAADTLAKLGVPHEVRVVSAHRAPDLLFEYASTRRGSRAAGDHRRRPAGRLTCPAWPRRRRRLPVLGVPVESPSLRGLDSLLSIVQMPAGIPVGDAGHRQGRGDQRGPVGRDDAREQGAEVPTGDPRVPGEADAGRGGSG